LLHSRALASPLGFGRVTLTKALEGTRTEMPFVDDVDSPGVLLNVVKPRTTVWFSVRAIRFARSCWREHEPARWLCWSRPYLARGNVGLSSQARYLSCSTESIFSTCTMPLRRDGRPTRSLPPDIGRQMRLDPALLLISEPNEAVYLAKLHENLPPRDRNASFSEIMCNPVDNIIEPSAHHACYHDLQCVDGATFLSQTELCPGP